MQDFVHQQYDREASTAEAIPGIFKVSYCEVPYVSP